MSRSEESPEQGTERFRLRKHLFEQWKRGELTISSGTHAIPRRAAHTAIPLSSGQERLWFLDQLSPGNAAYNLAFAVRFTGQLHLPILHRSLDELVRRHEILRTILPTSDGQATQVILPARTLPLPVVDLRELPADEQKAQEANLARTQAGNPFNLARGPLLRVTFLRLAGQEGVMLLVVHHTIFDAWSLRVLLQDLTQLYQALLSGTSSPLPELPVQYADVAAWQRTWVQGETLEKHRAYWKKQLAGASGVLNLPTDRPRPPLQTFQGASIACSLTRESVAKLKELSRQEGVTMFMSLLATLHVLLALYCGQDDILVGIPIAHRQQVASEQLIGFFANTLVLRTALTRTLTFQQLLGRVRETTLDAYAHQDMPFERLVEELQPERDLSRNPLFQVMFHFGNIPGASIDLPGLRLSATPISAGTAMFDLWLALQEHQDGTVGETIEYNTDLFVDATIRRMLTHFQVVLDQLVAHPARPIAHCSLLTVAEQQQILGAWNATQAAYPQVLLHHLFETRAAQTPDARAVVCAEHTLTYRELNRRANQLAHYLRSLGVGPDIPVGICAQRSFAMIIGLLGILKAGGAYVPLDPTLPVERLAFMLSETQAGVVVTEQQFLQSLPTASVQMVCLDTDRAQISRQSVLNPPGVVQGAHMASILYTSGSTGKPKGVMSTHAGLCNRLLWMQDAFPLSTTDNVLQKTPFSFDVSIWESFWPLQQGACLTLARPEGHRDSAYLAAVIAREQITTIHFVPSMLKAFLEDPGVQHCQSIQRVFCSGETLPYDMQETFFHQMQAQLFNLYGPTEASIDVTHWRCERQSDGQPIPIGRPIANTQVYLLDRQLHPVPVGVTGEIYIAGVAIARGYLNQPGLTAERFVPHPLSDLAGARLYKTGDLARYQPDGTIVFLGRSDRQVKLRGVRIELGEIEAVLKHHPLLHDAAVTLLNDHNGTGRLVAYTVLHTGEVAREEPWQQGRAGLADEQVALWQRLFEETYRNVSSREPAFNIAGWEDSYTHRPFSGQAMHEWVDHSVERILALHPRHALEIGCGTGLILQRLAPHCALYYGTDFSPTALGYTHQQLRAAGSRLAHVTLLQQPADDFTGIAAGIFDTVILNSVVQFFPDVAYLLRVLDHILRVITPGGSVYLGDIRDLRLLEALHASVELYRAPSSLLVSQLQARIRASIDQENELCIAPAFFFALSERFSRLERVEVQLKGGRHHNELTKFRYDVVLRLKAETPSPPLPAAQPLQVNWQDERPDVPAVRQLLRERDPDVLRVTNVANARLAQEARLITLLHQPETRSQTIAMLRARLEEPAATPGVDPEELWRLAQDLPSTVQICWSEENDGSGAYDVQFCRKDARPVGASWASKSQQPWAFFVNDPLRQQRAFSALPTVQRYLKDLLPEYMVPSLILPLERLPLTAHGKVDLRALPEPDWARPQLPESAAAPTTPIEKLLSSIWSQVLNVEQVGTNSNFFALGGDSITSIRIVSRANEAGLQLTPRLLFQHKTIAELAALSELSAQGQPPSLSLSQAQPAASAEPAERPEPDIDQHTLKRVLADRRDIEEIYPLTPMQHHILAQRLHTGNAELYLQWAAPAYIRDAHINLQAYQQAWQRLIDQHPTMRTSFLWEGLSEPVQIVEKKVEIHLDYRDWSDLSPDAQEKQLETYMQQMRTRGMNLARAPHVQPALFKLTEKDYCLVLFSNNMLRDGWSSTLLVRDLEAFYESHCQGEDLQLHPARHYRDYVAWVRQQDLSRAERFWRKTLQGCTPSTFLLQRAARPPCAADTFVKEGVSLSLSTTTALQSVARKQQITLSTLQHAAWAIVLSHYSQQEDIVLGSLSSGRPTTLAGIEYTLGFFNIMVPVRVRVDRGRPLLPWLADLQALMVEAREYEYTPLARIKQWCGLRETAPLFDSYVVFENFPRYSYEQAGKRARQDFGAQFMDYHRNFLPTEYALRVEFWPFRRMMIMMSGYQHYFDSATITWLLGQMQRVLGAIVDNPAQRLGTVMQAIEKR